MNTTREAFTKPGGLRRKVTSTLLALSLSAGMMVGTATPAHAATSVKGCFVYQGGGSGLWGMPVELRATWDGITWYSVGGVKQLSATGCQFWDNVPPSAFVMMVVSSRQGTGYYSGNTTFAYPGYGFANLGTWWVTCTGVCY